ncbi:MAG: hypothetical protein M3Y08_13645 [Fibrobacterota bacterium]|nr:hypothetical protein [Fibrobacterota bacterium]
MKGKSKGNGWIEFQGYEVSYIRRGLIAGHFQLNWGKDFGWARYDSGNMELELKTARFGFSDGSWDEFFGTPWIVATTDHKTFLIYQGRGISLYRKPDSRKPDMLMLDPRNNRGEDWMAVDPGFRKALVPLTGPTRMFEVPDMGGTPLILVKVDIEKGTYSTHPMDHYADSYLGPDFILYRHYAPTAVEGEVAKTSHFSATDFDLNERDHPLLKLLNRDKDSLPDFHRRFHISSQGWALMGVHSMTIPSSIYLLSPEGEGSIHRLFEGGTVPIPENSLSQCAISDDGRYFVMITRHDPEEFPSAKGAVVHVARVEKVKGGFAARITRIGDFPDLWIGKPIWIPGTHALVMNSDPLDNESVVRIYDLDKHPIDWEKVPFANPK